MEESIQNLIQKYPEWKMVDNKLTSEWKTDDFEELKQIIQKLCSIADTLNHHPTVTYGYNSIRIETTTHDAGNVVTELDVALALKVGELFK